MVAHKSTELSTDMDSGVVERCVYGRQLHMFNVFSLQEAKAFGAEKWEVERAVGCCLERLYRACYFVNRTCTKHTQFNRFAEPEILRLTGEASSAGKGRAWFGLQEKKHLGKAEFIGRRLSDGDVLSHTTAALIHGLPVLSIPHKVQLINPSRSRSGERFTRRQRQLRPAEETVLWNSIPVTDPVRTVLDIATDISLEQAVAAFDALLRLEPVTAQGRKHAAREIIASNAKFSASMRVVKLMEYSTGLAESFGESVCMVVIRNLGIKGLVQQADIVDENGEFVARVDGLIPDKRIIIEFDGSVKHRDTAAGGINERGDQFMLEKQREHRLHVLGYTVVRIMWSDLQNPLQLKARLAAVGALG